MDADRFVRPFRRGPQTDGAEIQGTAGPGVMPGRVGDAADGRIFHNIADRRLEIGIRVDDLIVDRKIVQLVVLSMRQGDILRGPFDIIMHEAFALIQVSIQDKVQVGIHQGKSQDDDMLFIHNDIDAVHPGTEILIILENDIDGISIGAEMPAVLDGNHLAPDEGSVQSEI